MSVTMTNAVQHETLIQALEQNALSHPHKVFVRWVNNKCKVQSTLTYSQLLEQSGKVVNLLIRNGIQRGDRVMISYPFGLEFLAGFYGCMRLGAIACSVYPPNIVDKNKARFSFDQFNGQVSDAGAKVALTTASFMRGMQFVTFTGGQKTQITWLATDRLFNMPSTVSHDIEKICSNDIGFIQYSSGSTGTPKGIVLTHRAIMNNLSTLRSVLVDESTTNYATVNWMPQYHDYALFGAFLLPLCFVQVETVSASPIDFIKNPLLWADMIDEFEANFAMGPNFGYALLAKRMKASNNRVLKNQSITRASIAAEPIAPSTLDAMRSIGIPSKAIKTGYGLAENCVYITSCLGDEIRVLDGCVSCGLLETNEKYGKFIRIVTPEGEFLEEGYVGEIVVRGPDLASGYWNRLNSQDFLKRLSDGLEYLPTGDLGRIVEGRLYVMGRLKELIIVNGRNVYPTDIERAVESEFAEIVRPGSSVAFQNNENDVGLVVEVRKTAPPLERLSDTFSLGSIKRLVADSCGVDVGFFLALKQGDVPKTTSGKLKRTETRRRSIEGSWARSSILEQWAAGVIDDTVDIDADPTNSGKHIDSTMTTVRAYRDVEDLFRTLFGPEMKMDSSWEDNGLTSILHAELVSSIQDHFHVRVPVTFENDYPTPSLLKEFVEERKGELFHTTTEKLSVVEGKQLNTFLLSCIQAIGIISILILFSVSLLPSYFIGKALVKYNATFEIGSTGRYATWNWFPIVVPVFFLSFSILVVVTKFVVIGRYRPMKVNLGSWYYVRWWYVDRLLHLWENTIGFFILKTKIIWFFYRLLGAELSPFANIHAFVREFDLVKIGSQTVLKHNLKCRKFRPYGKGDDEPPTMVFRNIEIGKNCDISGMLSPGSVIGNATKVSSRSAIEEGGHVPDDVLAQGSPAYNAGGANLTKSSLRDDILLDIIKIAWMVVELYHFFALFLLAQMILNQNIPQWRYTNLMYWFLILPLTSMFGIVTSIILKWTLMGNRSRRENLDCLWVRATDWICDIHYQICMTTIIPLFGKSRVQHLILILHGLDTDFGSTICSNGMMFLTHVDHIKIRRSFLSSIQYDIKEAGGSIEVLDSVVGFDSTLCSGTKVVRSKIPPRSVIADGVFDMNEEKTLQKSNPNVWVLEMIQMWMPVMLFMCFIPPYEVFMATVYDRSVELAILGLVASIGTQGLVWAILLALIERIFLCVPKSIQSHLVGTYLEHSWANQYWNLFYLLNGSPLVSWYLMTRGCNVEGDLWYFGSFLYDVGVLSFGENTIIDDAHIMGHYFDGELKVKSTRVSGLLHQGCFAHAGAVVPFGEYAPYTTFLTGDDDAMTSADEV